MREDKNNFFLFHKKEQQSRKSNSMAHKKQITKCEKKNSQNDLPL